VAVGGELAGGGAVGKHGPDLAGAAAGGFEDEVAAVGRPTGTLVAAGIAGDFDGLAGDGVHDVNVVIAAGTAPTEGQELAVGRPGGIDDVAHVREIELLGVGAVGVHEIELRHAAAIADVGDGLAGLGIPRGRGVGGTAVGEGDALGTIAAGVGDEDVGGPLHGGGEHDLGAVGRPGGRGVGTAIAGEGDELVDVEGVHADLRG